MNKKILIGSIIAVAILILVSFTSVVGFQSVKSNVKASPLFTIRTNRAIGEESKDITAKHVGKENTLPFPKRDDRSVLTKIVIDNIRRIDDKTFEKAIAYIINSGQEDKRFNRINSDGIREALYLVRDSDSPIPILDANTKNKTFGYGFKGFLVWTLSEPFCIIKFIIGIIGAFIIWCANPSATGIGCPTIGCPRTLKRLF